MIAQPFRISYTCDKCGEGELEHDSQFSEEGSFAHFCNNCSDWVMDMKSIYPRIEYQYIY